MVYDYVCVYLQQGHLEVVQQLLMVNPQFDVKDSGGQTALIKVCNLFKINDRRTRGLRNTVKGTQKYRNIHYMETYNKKNKQTDIVSVILISVILFYTTNQTSGSLQQIFNTSKFLVFKLISAV